MNYGPYALVRNRTLKAYRKSCLKRRSWSFCKRRPKQRRRPRLQEDRKSQQRRARKISKSPDNENEAKEAVILEVVATVDSSQDDHHHVLGPRHHAAEDHPTDLLHVAMPTHMCREEPVAEEGEGEETIVVVVLSVVLIPDLDLGRLQGRIEEPAR